MGGIRK
jgi:hypothetical protein